MKNLIKKATSMFCVGGLLLVLATAVGSIQAANLAGTLLHNGSPMSGITAETPDFYARIYGTTQDITADVTFTYYTTTGAYTITNLPNKKVTLSMVFHLHGSASTLPGNYRGAAYPDIPNLTPGELANYDIDERLVIHMTSPWDNDAIEFAIFPGSPYPAHNSPVWFQWDAVPGRDEYSFIIKKYRDPDHPSGYGYISTVLDTRILNTFWNALLDPSGPNEHYQAEIQAWNLTANKTIAFYMTTYTNGYGVQYRFKLVGAYNGPIWYVDPDATGKYRNGSDWEHAFENLQDALAAAGSGDEIWVAESIYRPDRGAGQTPGDRDAAFDLTTGVGVYGGFAGGESSRNERDSVANVTILSGDLSGNDGPGWANNGENSYHVVTSAGNDQYTVLDGFTITGGNAEGSYPRYIGGGVYISGGDVVISNCIIAANSSRGGGGLAIRGGGSPLLYKCVIIGNTSNTATGGGLDIQIAGPMLRSCLILGNTAGGRGGALNALNNSAPPTLTNCVISGNLTDTMGAAIANSGVGGPNPNPPILTNCTINNNTAGSQAGGIYNSNGNDVILNSCILWDNSDSGGTDESAQVMLSGGAAVIEYSCIQGWTGTLGGTGNIGLNPMLVDPDGLDDVFGTEDDNYRLLMGSPCIDTGHPGAAYNDPDGSRNDMGAYGGPWADQSIGYSSLPGSGFLFTTVGNIPTSFITEDNLDPAEIIGTANVDPVSGSNYSIHPYTNSPFGSKIRLHGLFGSTDNVDYYRVLIAGPWDGVTPPAPGDFTPLDDKLYKTWSWWSGTEWASMSLKIGPQTVRSVDNMYYLTTDGFWSHLDLRLILDTRQHPNGLYTIRCKGYDDTGSTLIDVTPGNAKDLIIRIDNSPVTAKINNVKYDPNSPNYDPIDDGEIKECAIINLETDSDNLRFNITATHPNGYLRTWILDNIAGKNDNRGIIARQSYSPPPGPLWFGVTGIQFETDDAPPPPVGLDPWIRCAYQFRLRAYSRVTNGYGYIYWAQFSDHYFLDLGGSYGCHRADINRSGKVDVADLSEMAAHWAETCPIE